ncbi:hypothetical protein [Chryseolinea sp. H1M3-3]|uniref:hypothetical protein n=1 Tax=Chryseolinea sp. H1M3-3 TaxID=3034144 RepID=UPI0023EDCC16|nr:hypothetical protein [Chryseolinea sp. H1M3-3]
MSKKKNTLQDLNAFLKQQAATLVTPETFSATVETTSEVSSADTKNILVQNTFNDIGAKDDPAFRKKLYEFIIQSLEDQKNSLPEDKMLINTALYLQHGSDWKNAIRQYWRNRP